MASKNNNQAAAKRKTTSNTRKPSQTRSKSSTQSRSKSSTQSTGQKKPRTTTKKPKETIKQEGILQDEIILVITLVVSALLFISNIGIGGAVGKYVSGFLFGMVGLLAYVLPFALFFGTAFHISNYGNRTAEKKIINGIILYISLASLIQLITLSGTSLKISDYFVESMNGKNGGGIIGGMIVFGLQKAFGLVGSYIILLAAVIISMITISGKAIFTYLAKQSKDTLDERREYQKILREQDEFNQAHGLTTTERKPAKTFILDPQYAEVPQNQSGQKTMGTEVKIDKVKKSLLHKKKGAQTEELETIPVEHLLNGKQNSSVTNQPDMRMENLKIHTYEDELQNKFGKNWGNHKIEDSGTVGELGVTDLEFEIGLEDRMMIEEEMSLGRNGMENHSFINDFNNDDSDDIQVNSIEELDDSVVSTDVEHRKPQSLNNKREINPENMSDKDSNKSVRNDKHNSQSTDVENLGIAPMQEQKEYKFPSLDLLNPPKPKVNKGASAEKNLKETAMKLQSTLESFGVHVTITNVSCGPTVTRYELQPEQGVKVKSITSLADDIKLSLAAAEIRIEAPIPGKSAVGIEVPNKENAMVTLREILESPDFMKHPSDIAFSVGKDIGGQTIVTDIAKMPHLLIAGATGSGKSVCINTLIMSILYKANPSDVRMIMVDPKVVELSVYNGIPHLLIPVVTDPKKASAALNWAVVEMTERYKKFADYNVRDLKGYNEKAAEVAHLNDPTVQKLPQIIIIVDELADLMMVAPGEVEDAICRLAQLARAAGIHLVIATQRPSVNVITGLIKANVPSRIAFSVSSAIDSRTILDGGGAEKLLGRGDMLFFPSGYPKPVRVQGAFVSDKEVGAVVEFLKNSNQETSYNEEVNEKITSAKIGEGSSGSGNDRDDYFMEAGKFIIEKDKASIGMLQRVYKIGFNRAARIMDQLADAGVVGPEEGTKPRKVLMSVEDFENYLEENG